MGDELVECRSGFAYAERPLALRWDGERLEIEQVEAQSHTPEGKRFRVRVRDGRVFDLVYDELNDEWRVKPV